MGTTPSLWRYDVGAYDTPLLAESAKAYDYALRSVTAMRARTFSHDVPNLRSRGSPRNGGSTAISGPISRSRDSSPTAQIRSSYAQAQTASLPLGSERHGVRSSCPA